MATFEKLLHKAYKARTGNYLFCLYFQAGQTRLARSIYNSAKNFKYSRVTILINFGFKTGCIPARGSSPVRASSILGHCLLGSALFRIFSARLESVFACFTKFARRNFTAIKFYVVKLYLKFQIR